MEHVALLSTKDNRPRIPDTSWAKIKAFRRLFLWTVVVNVVNAGTVITASAHIITAIIGSGALSLAWAVAQLGSLPGSVALLVFSVITLYTSILLTDCYRSPEGTRNYSYMDAVRTHLGGIQYMFCALAQYATLIGLGIGYVITTALSIGAIERTNCYHKYGHDWPNCSPSTRNYIIEFGAVQMILSQVSNFHKLSFISMVAAIMSFTYSIIGIALSAVRIAGGTPVTTSVTGVPIDNNTSAVDKMWKTFSALGNIAIAFAFSIVVIEIQDTLKASPRENRVMKQATFVGIMVSSFFYTLCGIVGYAAFGVDAPGNLLTDDHGFFEPYWLVDFANACKAVHLIGAYQVFTQPVFAFVERWSRRRWPESRFITAEYNILGCWEFSFFRLLWRTGYVIFTVIVGFIFPFFNAFVGLLGAISFWPLTIYFPTQMYMTQAKIRRFSFAWFCLQTLSLFCFIVSLLAAAGSVRNLIKYVIHYQPFDP